MAVVGIGLCCGVIVATLSFVCYHRLTLRQLRAKQDTQTPAYRAMLANKHTDTAPPAAAAAARSRIKQPPASPAKQTPSSARRQRTTAGVSTASPSSRAAAASAGAQLTLFQSRTPPCHHHSPAAALRSTAARARSRSPRELLDCVRLVPAGGGESFMMETRPPVEGRDSLSVEHVLDTAAAAGDEEQSGGELKTASYVPPAACSVAVRRPLEPTLVTRATSPMSTSDMDVLLPDISALLTSGTETDNDVTTMTGARSWSSSSLSDLVAGCDTDSDHCRPHTTSPPRRILYKGPPWNHHGHHHHHHHHHHQQQQSDAMLEPDVYYC